MKLGWSAIAFVHPLDGRKIEFHAQTLGCIRGNKFRLRLEEGRH